MRPHKHSGSALIGDEIGDLPIVQDEQVIIDALADLICTDILAHLDLSTTP